MNKNKQLIVNMAASFIAYLVSMGISFFLSPYIVENIGVEAYGFVGLSNSFISYATVITAALNSMASRFITIAIHREEYENVNKYFTSVVAANIFLALPLTVAATVIVLKLDKVVNVSAALLPDVQCLWALLFANFIIGLIGNAFNVATFSQNRLDLSARRNMESQFLKVIVLLLAFRFFKASVWYVGLAAFLCGLYVIAVNLYYTKKFLPYVKIRKRYFDFEKIKQLIFSGIWNSVSQLSGILTTGLDLLISNWFVGAEAMGIVSVSKTVPIYVRSLFGTLGSMFAPNLTILYAKNNYEDMAHQVMSSVRLLGYFACIPIAFIFVYSHDFFTLWVPDQNGRLLHTLAVLGALEMPIGLSLEPMYNIFVATNKVKISSLMLIVSSTISMSLTLILLNFVSGEAAKLCVIVGASTLVEMVRVAICLPIYSAKCLKVKWCIFYPVIGKVFLSTGITVAISVGIRSFLRTESWMSLIVAVILTSVAAVVINYFFMLTSKERMILKSKILRGRGQNDS